MKSACPVCAHEGPHNTEMDIAPNGAMVAVTSCGRCTRPFDPNAGLGAAAPNKPQPQPQAQAIAAAGQLVTGLKSASSSVLPPSVDAIEQIARERLALVEMKLKEQEALLEERAKLRRMLGMSPAPSN